MRNFKRASALLAALLLLLSVCLCGCGGEPTYKVTVKDALGNAYTSGVIVRFMQNGQQAAMQPIDEQGVAAKQLPAGEYTVELMFTSDETAYHYDASGVVLSAKNPEAEVTLSYKLGENSQTLFAQGTEAAAYHVSTGCTYAELKSGRNYFLFTPSVAGTYEFSLVGAEGTIGYYGAPHFVQETSSAEVVNNAFTVSVKASMIGTNNTGTTVMVIGVDVAADTNGIVAIERIGEPEHTVEDEPWTVYQTTANLTAYTLPASASTVDFDITAASDAYTLVLNENDGYYHLNTADGPLVLVKLGKHADLDYIDPFQVILDHSGVNKYFFDESGAFVKKESYSECLLEYFEYVDEKSGLYPLTEDLKYIIQQRGEYSGWFDADEGLYLFKDENGEPVPNVNADISWLFMCCYMAQ